MFGLVAMPAWAQDSARATIRDAINGLESTTHRSFQGIPTDWSSHHLVFSKPEPGSDAEFQVQQDPRYWLQQIRRSQLQSEDSAEIGMQASGVGSLPDIRPRINRNKTLRKGKIEKDWSVSLGSGGKVGAGFFPAKYSFDASAANCSDYVAFNTSLAGSATHASIIAFTKLYVGGGCGTPNPSTAWAYNTGGTILTSVELSLDGKQMAFVHSAAGGASLEILRPVNGQGTSATAPVSPGTTSTTGAAYNTCKAGAGSCLLSLAFSGAHNDTNSSPFYVYFGTAADTMFVGDDSGFLHKFTNVFNGTPSEVTTGGWPAQVAVVKISDPVYDSASGTVLVLSSYDGTSNGGRVHETNASTGANVASNEMGPTTASGSACHGGASGTGTALTLDAPILDATANRMYAFVGNNGAGSSAVYQFVPGFASNSCGSMETVGTGSTTGIPVYTGAFDGIYFASTPTSPTGNLYVCGNAGGNATFYRVPISGNALGAPSAVSTALSTATTTCSPVTEFENVGVDRAFVSVQASGNTAGAIGCPATGCIMSFNVSAGTTPTATSAAAGETGGTSGIVIDNLGATAGASQVYFSTLTGSTAIQASQAGLN